MTTFTDRVLPEVRYLTQPGTPLPQRIDAYPTTLHPISVELPAGTPLLEALRQAVFEQGYSSAFGELRGGTFTSFDYYIPAVCQAGTSVATFSDPITGRSPATFMRGGLTIGLRDGEVFTHCHAQFVDADGIMRAGHLIPESVIVGAGVTADLYASRDVAMTVLPDTEINFSVFQPRPAAPTKPAGTASGGLRSVVARVHPNIDIIEAIENLAEEHGFETAVIRGKIGSFVGATLVQGDQLVSAPGPAVEVMYLDGGIRRDETGSIRAELTCAAAAVDGNVYSGALVRGHNPIAMTFELALSEPAEATTQ
ncbi:PCC domain-containing protein [Rhodococcus sp. MSC1_016]|jgi:predicted DNA-binding protein with PD1-like motif|uniref:PCC domain-containing protein n=1 Tax=Rhodococcus sp. MSC1_016 TaxID=2909266 RepID=UPI00203057C8|nr:PPC domain-containing DNA-binding protein [Rhodococcus sp. MSC1_016]